MNRLIRSACIGVLCALGMACSGGDGEGQPVEPEVGDFVLDAATQEELDDIASDGFGAEGTYEYDSDAGTLTFEIDATTFECGIETGTIVATVIDVESDLLVLRFGEEAEDGLVTWTRRDSGATEREHELVGVWSTTEPELFLILDNDGGMQLLGADAPCDDGPDDRERNEENCLSVEVDGGSDITIDGDFDDWNAIGSQATLEDDEGDYLGDDDGADLSELQVAFSFDKLYVRMDVHSVPSENFWGREAPNGGTYRLTLRGDNGLSIFHRVAYSPESQTWFAIDNDPSIEIGVGHAGIEWSIDVGSFQGEGFETIDLIMVEPMDCGVGSCEALDYMDCAWMQVPQ